MIYEAGNSSSTTLGSWVCENLDWFGLCEESEVDDLKAAVKAAQESADATGSSGGVWVLDAEGEAIVYVDEDGAVHAKEDAPKAAQKDLNDSTETSTQETKKKSTNGSGGTQLGSADIPNYLSGKPTIPDYIWWVAGIGALGVLGLWFSKR